MDQREEVTAEWIQLHNDKLHNFSFPNIIVVIKSVRMTWAKHIVHLGEVRNMYRMLVGKRDWKRLHESPKCRREVMI
jgi:hypothetical protein